MMKPRRAAHVAVALSAVLAAGVPTAIALHARALDRIAEQVERRSFHLRTSLREPARQAESMQAPMLDRKGWHYLQTAGPILLHQGEVVQVKAVFNYSEKGFFVELAPEPARDRKGLRFRVMVETPGDDVEGQVAEGLALLGKVLDLQAGSAEP